MDIRQIDITQHGKTLYELDVAAFCRPYDYPSPSVPMTLSYLKGCIVYLAYDDGQPVGVLAYEIKGNEVEVKQVLVHPSRQGKGIGSCLVGKLIDDTADKHIWLVTHPKNTAAIITYLKNGFEITQWKDNYYGDGQPRLILKLSNCGKTK